jgi:hypothetical protein
LSLVRATAIPKKVAKMPIVVRMVGPTATDLALNLAWKIAVKIIMTPINVMVSGPRCSCSSIGKLMDVMHGL